MSKSELHSPELAPRSARFPRRSKSAFHLFSGRAAKTRPTGQGWSRGVFWRRQRGLSESLAVQEARQEFDDSRARWYLTR